MKKKLLSLLLALSLLAGLALPALAAETAAVIRLEKTTGEVSVKKSSGKAVSLISNMRLYGGYHVVTDQESYAWINLDSSKLLKEDAESEVEIRKDGKRLEVLVSSGNVFFDVAEPLEDDESMCIRTSTMAVGIRGTSGYVQVSDGQVTWITVLEGEVQCSVTDPVTGQAKTEPVYGGERARGVVYDPDRAGDKCDIIKEKIAVEEIPGYVLTDVVRDVDLCDKIKENTGLDILEELAKEAGGDPSGKAPDGKSASPEVLGIADQREDEDEADLRGKLEEIEKELEEQERKKPVVSPNKALESDTTPPPPPEDDDDDDDDGDPPAPAPAPAPVPDPDPEPTPPTPVTYTIAFDANGGKWATGAVQIPVQTNPDGTAAWPEAPARAGFNFTGWYDAFTGGNAIARDHTFSGDKTIFAQWTPAGSTTYQVTFDANGGLVNGGNTSVQRTSESEAGKLDPWPEDPVYGDTSYSPLNNDGSFRPAKDNQLEFLGWFDSPTSTNEVTADNEFKADTTLYARWDGWFIDSATNTLVVAGSGNMADYIFQTEIVDGGGLFFHHTTAPWGVQMLYDSEQTIKAIQNIVIKDGVTGIGNYAFFGGLNHNNGLPEFAQKITSVSIPDSVTSIGENAFENNTKLQSVTLPSKLEIIGDSAFVSCFSLTSVNIPASVTSIGSCAFLHCNSNLSITFDGTIAQWRTFDQKTGEYPTNATVTCSDGTYKVDGSEGVSNP